MRIASLASASVLAFACAAAAADRIEPVPLVPISARTSLLDFESGPIPTPSKTAYGLHFYTASPSNRGVYTWSIDPTQGAAGTHRSLRLDVRSGQFYFWFLSDDRKAYVPGARGASRLSFWIKVPPGWGQGGHEYQNLNVGTYLRDPLVWKGQPETRNNHHYFQLFLVPTGEWMHVVVGDAPHHQRGLGGLDPAKASWRPEIASFYGALTRFYVCGVPCEKEGFSPMPAGEPYTAWIDEVELYYEDDRVVAHPEYGLRRGAPGEVVEHRVRITNTHPTETRRFAVRATSPRGTGWAKPALSASETPALAPGESLDVVLTERVPAEGERAKDRKQTSVIAWQIEPAVKVTDVAVQNRTPFADRGDGATPAAGALFVTERAPAPATSTSTIPGAITDLSARWISTSAAEVSWTSVGGAANDLRVALNPIGPDDFRRAMPVGGEPVPGPAGRKQSMVVSGLSRGTVYHFGIRVDDEDGHAGPPSASTPLPAEAGKS
jgi:hypothetical protein